MYLASRGGGFVICKICKRFNADDIKVYSERISHICLPLQFESGPFRCKWTVSVPFRKRCNTVAKSLLHKRRVETFLSVSVGFSLQIHFKQKVAKMKNRLHLFATINLEKLP
jgi:hypothetical protein